MTKSLIDILRTEVNSEHVAFTKFITAYKKDSNIFYCFYEGKEDKKYYSIRIEQNTKRKTKSFSCGGKDKVIKAYRLIKSKKEYQTASTMFFVDKDFDFTKSKLTHIYYTPYYSIENFYSGEETLKNILTHEFEIDSENKDFKKILRLFKSLQKKFHNEILYFNSWLACQYDIRVQTNNSTFLKIDDVVDKYFNKIVKNDLTTISDFSDLKKRKVLESTLFPKAPKIEYKKLKAKKMFFKTLESYKYFRGKFEIKFMISFLLKLQSEIGKRNSKVFSQKYKCNLRFEYCNSISTLSQYAETPKCLVKYLKKLSKKAA